MIERPESLRGPAGRPAAAQRRYCDATVALARVLDRANVAVRAARWYFSDFEENDSARYEGARGMPAWVRNHQEHLGDALRGLKAAFHARVSAETPNLVVDIDEHGASIMPRSIYEIFHPVLVSKHGYPSPKDDTAVQFEVPLEVRARQPDKRVVLFDADAYLVPADIDDSVVEVWFRRLFHAPQFSGQWGEPYPLYLVERDYGWQCYGLER